MMTSSLRCINGDMVNAMRRPPGLLTPESADLTFFTKLLVVHRSPICEAKRKTVALFDAILSGPDSPPSTCRISAKELLSVRFSRQSPINTRSGSAPQLWELNFGYCNAG